MIYIGQGAGHSNSATVVTICTTLGQSSAGWMTVENMSLAAVAEGLGSNIITYWDDAKKEVEKLIGLTEGYELICVLRLGVPEAEVMRPERRPEFSWLHKNKF